MSIEPPTVDQLTTVISHATAPAFMLGAVAGFLSILISRSERVMDTEREAAERPGGTSAPLLSVLGKRVRLLHAAIYFSVLSALCTALLLIAAFVSVFAGFHHQIGMAILFAIALALLMASLVLLARDIKLAIETLPRR
jgi:hypothetical protein